MESTDATQQTTSMHTDDVHELVDESGSIAGTPSAVASSAAAAAAAPAASPALPAAPRRSGRSHTSSLAGSAGSKRAASAASSAASAVGPSDNPTEKPAEAVSSGPVGKRARTTRAGPASVPSAAPAAVAQLGPMMRLLGRDTGAQFVLFELLDLEDLASLHSTCRSWRRWLDEGSFGSNRELECHQRVPVGLRSCRWVRHFVRKLSIGHRSRKWDDAYGNHVPRYQNRPELERGTLAQIALRLMPLFPRLRAFRFEFDEAEEEDALIFNRRLAQAAPHLTALEINVREEWTIDSCTPALLPSIHHLSSLTSLKILSGGLKLKKADFSSLPQLPHLQTFVLGASNEDEWPRFCSKAQVAALVACRSLTELDVGDWVPEQFDADVGEQELSEYWRTQLDNGLGALIQGRKLNGAAPLRKLRLGSPGFVTPAVAQHFLTLTELESTWLLDWSCKLTADHWNQLRQFTRLHTLHIGAIDGRWGSGQDVELDAQRRPLLQLDAPLAALQHCPALSSLHLDGKLLLLTAHVTLLASFPSLRSLSLDEVRVQSLQPLIDAASLTELELKSCSLLDATSFSLQPTVPFLPQLTALTLHGDFALSTSDVAFLASFPRLRSLCLVLVRLESLAPLTNAPTLFSLEFRSCKGAAGSTPCIRSMIPPMLRLSSLSISDGGKYSKEEAAPINAAMFARLPSLNPLNLAQWYRETRPWRLLAINGNQPVYSGPRPR